MGRTVEQYLEILRSDPEFMKILQESNILRWRFKAHVNKQGVTITPAGKAVEFFRSGPTRSKTNLYLERVYGANLYGRQEASKFKDALRLWLAEVWEQVDHA